MVELMAQASVPAILEGRSPERQPRAAILLSAQNAADEHSLHFRGAFYDLKYLRAPVEA
jgi:hypothetical protein